MDYIKDILKRDFYRRDTSEVARDLLGKILIKKSGSDLAGGIIIETEAYYGPDDPASHAFGGITPRSRIMFKKAGIAYVYLCYGVYWLLNVVTEEEEKPGAVLIRGLRPLEGIEIMEKRRKTDNKKALADGPGKLTIALGIDSSDNGKDMTSFASGIYITCSGWRGSGFKIKNTPRVGISNGRDRMLRYLAIGL